MHLTYQKDDAHKSADRPSVFCVAELSPDANKLFKELCLRNPSQLMDNCDWDRIGRLITG